MPRFQRDFELTIQVSDTQAVVIKPPMRVQFSADKSVSGGLNKINVKAFNLTKSNREAIQKDEDQQKRVPFALRAGYVDQLETIFKGTVFKASSRREGADIVTDIEGIDGGHDFLNSFVSKTTRGKGAAIDGVLADLPNTGKGKVTESTPLIRPKVMVGSAMHVLDSIIGEGESWYVDDEQLYIIKDNESTSRFAPLVNSDTGLIDTPERKQSRVTFTTLLNPAIKIGGLIQLESLQAPQINGVYKVESMGYSGDNYGQAWSQTITAILAGGFKVLS